MRSDMLKLLVIILFIIFLIVYIQYENCKNKFRKVNTILEKFYVDSDNDKKINIISTNNLNLNFDFEGNEKKKHPFYLEQNGNTNEYPDIPASEYYENSNGCTN